MNKHITGLKTNVRTMCARTQQKTRRPFQKRRVVTMKFLLLFILFLSHSVSAGPRTIVAGDNVFVSAQIIGCGTNVIPVEYARVLESGEATFFKNIKLTLVGHTEEQAASKISDEIGKRTGRRLKTLQVKVVPDTDPETNSNWLLMLLNTKRTTCQLERVLPPEVPADGPEWKEKFLLTETWPHNQSINGSLFKAPA